MIVALTIHSFALLNELACIRLWKSEDYTHDVKYTLYIYTIIYTHVKLNVYIRYTLDVVLQRPYTIMLAYTSAYKALRL